MAIGEPWPWGRWHGNTPPPWTFPWWGVTPPPNPYAPQPRIVTTSSTASLTVHPEHKCRVRTSPFDRKRWVTTCQRCGFTKSTRNRADALEDALGHRYFARDYTQMARELELSDPEDVL